jgi:sulfur-oxidizing protein SoxY
MPTSIRLPSLPLLLLLLLFGVGVAQAQLPSGDKPEASPVWLKVKASLFEGRAITPANKDTLILEAPSRAVDAAVVPIVIRSLLPQTATRYVSKLYLLIDANPSPITAVFHFTPDNGRVDIETRVRVDEYSFVRAVAETNDGQLVMATRYVKASGGCSAAAGSDPAVIAANMGKMRFVVDGDLRSAASAREPVRAQFQVNHPNHSGFAMDQATRQFTPAHYVRRVDISQGGRTVLTADVDFGIAENPMFRFYFVPKGDGEMQALVLDSLDKRFSGSARDAPH